MNGSKCQLCENHVAKIHITQIKDDQLFELHVCPDCARNHGLSGPGKTPDLSTGSLTGKPPADEEATFAEPPEGVKTCPSCGQTFRGFRESGRLGCRHCYDAFQEELVALLRKVQMGMTQHGPTTPAAPAKQVRSVVVDIQELREELKKAVGEEDFERAARLRDEIRNLEKETKA